VPLSGDMPCDQIAGWRKGISDARAATRRTLIAFPDPPSIAPEALEVFVLVEMFSLVVGSLPPIHPPIGFASVSSPMAETALFATPCFPESMSFRNLPVVCLLA